MTTFEMKLRTAFRKQNPPYILLNKNTFFLVDNSFLNLICNSRDPVVQSRWILKFLSFSGDPKKFTAILLPFFEYKLDLALNLKVFCFPFADTSINKA